MSISQADVDALFGGGDTSAPSDSPPASGDQPAGDALAAPALVQPIDQEAILKRILALEVPVAISLAEKAMSIEAILKIEVGTIVEFDVSFDAELTLFVGDQPIGRGHAVKIGENFGLRVTRIMPMDERIDALGSGASF